MVRSLASLRIYFLMLCADKSFDDEESVDGNRPSSAASAFKVPAPKTSGNPVNSGRKPGSAGGPKVGGNVDPCACFMHLDAQCFGAVCLFMTAAEMRVWRECCLLQMNIINCYFHKNMYEFMFSCGYLFLSHRL